MILFETQIPHPLRKFQISWTQKHYNKKKELKERRVISSSYLCATSLRTVYLIFLSKHLSFRFSRNLTREAILRERFERFGVSPTP